MITAEGHSRSAFLLAAGLCLLLACAACSSGGASRGKVSDAAARSAEEERSGRGTGSMRTKIDHLDRDSHGWEQDDDNDDDDDDSLLVGFLIGVFRGGDDKEPEPGPAREFNEIGAVRTPDDGGAVEDDRPAVPRRKNLIVSYAQGTPAGNAIARMTTVSALYSRYSGSRRRDHLGLYYGEGRKGPQATVRDGIDSIFEFGVDVGSRHYLTALHTFTGFYILYGARAGGLSWQYTNPVPVVTGTTSNSVSEDISFVLSPYAGLGCALVQVRPFNVGASVSWGLRLSLGRTAKDSRTTCS